MKRYIKYIYGALSLIVVTLAFIGLTRRTDFCDDTVTAKPLDFVVTAFDDEQEAVLSRVEILQSCKMGDTTYYVVEYQGKRLVTYMSGIGPDAATRSTEQTLNSFTVRSLIFAGIAGAVDQNLNVGDTVVVETWYDLGGGEPISIDETFLKRAVQENIVVVERGITVDYFATDTSLLPVQASIVDMETYDIADVAHRYSVPFIAFRSVSDFADGFKNSASFDVAAGKSADAALTFVVDD